MLPKFKKLNKRIYLDYAAATPLDEHVQKAMLPFFGPAFGNASALYAEGRQAAAAVAQARDQIAAALGARSFEIVFTAGGTESANLAIFGTMKKFVPTKKHTPHIITTAIEHHAVLEPCRELERQGFNVTYLPVDKEGRVEPEMLKKSIRPETVLISIMYANNEIGTVQPIQEISKIVRVENIARRKRGEGEIVFHTDACQAAGFLDIQVNHLGVDLLTLNASKIYGPKQVGCLYVRSGIGLEPVLFGGGQEKNFRSGTENVAGIVGMAKAFSLIQTGRADESKRLALLRNYFITNLRKLIPELLINGYDSFSKKVSANRNKKYRIEKKPETQTDLRLPNNINITIPGVEGEMLMLYLDAYGISIATGSACTATSNDPSHVLKAIGRSDKESFSSIRITLGKYTTKKDIEYTTQVLNAVVKELRGIKNDNY